MDYNISKNLAISSLEEYKTKIENILGNDNDIVITINKCIRIINELPPAYPSVFITL